MDRISGADQAPYQGSVIKPKLADPPSAKSSSPQQAPEQLVTKPEKEKEFRGMADFPQPPWKYWLRVGSAAVGVGVGLMMFPVWCLVYGNTSAGLWALFSSLPAGIVLYQHLRFKKAALAQTLPPSRLLLLRNIALVCSLLTGVATVVYPATAAVQGQPLRPYSDSYVITGVWAFMSFKWSAGLAYFSHHYRTRLLKDREYNTF